MAVRLRLTRMGRKKRPFYRIVAVDSRRRRDGKYLEKVGHYNPLTTPPEIVIDEAKALEWLMKGAQPTDTVRSLFRNFGIMMKFDLMKKGASPEKIDEEMKKVELLKKAREESKKTSPKKEAKKTEAEPVVEEKTEEPVEAAPAEVPAEEEKTEELVEAAPAEEPVKEEKPEPEEVKTEEKPEPSAEPAPEAETGPESEEKPSGPAPEEK